MDFHLRGNDSFFVLFSRKPIFATPSHAGIHTVLRLGPRLRGDDGNYMGQTREVSGCPTKERGKLDDDEVFGAEARPAGSEIPGRLLPQRNRQGDRDEPDDRAGTVK
jgi:hypothetical protein